MQSPDFNYLSGRDSFDRIRAHTWNLMLSQSQRVPSSPWQGREAKPEFATHELMNYTFTHSLAGVTDLQAYRDDIKPNLPWADDHFKERVCGSPINPGIQWANWPWGGSADSFRDEHGMFNHNYMERYWPKYAGGFLKPSTTAEERAGHVAHVGGFIKPLRGIRNDYGDLNDLVKSLAANPLSRQEWFPIFHPEDVGQVVGGRKPCSLGYQFWVRNKQLHCYYPLRSCDFMHHMPDDIYLTIRLMLWVLGKCQGISLAQSTEEPESDYWADVKMGTLTMHCTSLHVFANDFIAMSKEGPK